MAPAAATAAATAATATTAGGKKVALIFWGLTRNLKRTWPDMKRNVFDVLANAGWDHKVFIHTYYFQGPYNNTWAKEFNVQLDFDEYKLLAPYRVMREDQNEVLARLNVRAYMSKGWKHWASGTPQMIQNFVLALYSLKQATLLFEAANAAASASAAVEQQYDKVIFLRPDTLFPSPLDVKILDRANLNTVVVPDWGHFHGYNDKFAVAAPAAALVYGKRFDGLLAHSRARPLHSETYLKVTLDKAKISVVSHSIKFLLVRAGPKNIKEFK